MGKSKLAARVPRGGKAVRLDTRPRPPVPPTQREQSARDTAASQFPPVTVGTVDASMIHRK